LTAFLTSVSNVEGDGVAWDVGEGVDGSYGSFDIPDVLF
jgi:hypothetical protein